MSMLDQKFLESIGELGETNSLTKDMSSEIKEKLDPKIAEIESPLIMYSKIKKILWASGDKKEPLVESIQAMHKFIEDLLSTLYNPKVMTEVVKWQNPMISKRFKLRKLLKYLLKVFPVETCTFFNSVELKKTLREGRRMKKRRQKTETTQGNPILEIEKEVKDPKYDKYREKHEDTVSE